MAAMHWRALWKHGGPGRCRDWSSRSLRVGELLPRFFGHSPFVTHQTSAYVIGFLVMVKGAKGGNNGWHLDEIPLNLYTLQCWKTRKDIDFCRMPLALCAGAVTKATFKWHARTCLCATQIIKPRLSFLPPSFCLSLSLSILGFRNSRAVCLCTSRCK